MIAWMAALGSAEERVRFQEIYEQNYRKMYYIARRLAGDEAEDVVQEAFLRLADRFDRYDTLSPRRLEALCVTITKHIAIDLLRRRKHLAQEPEQALLYTEDDAPLIEQVAEQNELSRYVAETLRRLPENLQNVLWLKYYLEYSNREIARTLGISEKNVEMRLYRGRKRLADLICWAKPEE
ncbi:MAG: sigma-70 family RNA polymerase sigma factor [Blautia sp.]|nr:sigma-70 family RNA polymerase sigma factor [Blautia sp.]